MLVWSGRKPLVGLAKELEVTKWRSEHKIELPTRRSQSWEVCRAEWRRCRIEGTATYRFVKAGRRSKWDVVFIPMSALT